MSTYKSSTSTKLIITVFLLLINLSGYTQNWSEVIKGSSSDRSNTDNLGFSVAISGNYAIVGARFESEDVSGGNTLSLAGSAYLFEQDSNGLWNEVQKIVASNRTAADNFGHSVAISGNRVVVGAPVIHPYNVLINRADNAGSAYVFERNNSGVWVEVKRLTASDRTSEDQFGSSVSISGNTVIVGAPLEDEDTAGSVTIDAAGSAYIYERDSTGIWNETQKIVASDRGLIDNFGSAVCISGSELIVGARYESHDINGGNKQEFSGSAYIFERNTSGVWQENQKIVASDRKRDALFGYSVSISGNYALIGAGYENLDTAGANFMSRSGAAYMFEKNVAGIWSETQKIVASDRNALDRFGWSVSIFGDNAIIGSFLEDEDIFGGNSFSDAGSAYIFKRNSLGHWNETQKMVASDRAPGDQFGYSVSMSGNSAIVGAPSKKDSSAAVPNYAGISYFLKMNTTVGGNKIKPHHIALIYPNPTNGRVFIRLNQFQKNLTLRLYSISGKLIQAEDFQNVSEFECVIDQPDGLYLIEVVDDAGKRLVTKLIKK